MSNLLEEIRKTDPGRYLTREEASSLSFEGPGMVARIKAAQAAQAMEDQIVEATVLATLKKFEYERKHDFAKEKCMRDVGYVYRYAVFSMLCEDRRILDDKLLLWMRTVLQAQGFPEGIESIKWCYTTLLLNVRKKLQPEHVTLLEPYFAGAVEILSS